MRRAVSALRDQRRDTRASGFPRGGGKEARTTTTTTRDTHPHCQASFRSTRTLLCHRVSAFLSSFLFCYDCSNSTPYMFPKTFLVCASLRATVLSFFLSFASCIFFFFFYHNIILHAILWSLYTPSYYIFLLVPIYRRRGCKSVTTRRSP